MTPLSWRIGDVKITKIVELETTGSTKFILPQATREEALKVLEAASREAGLGVYPRKVLFSLRCFKQTGALLALPREAA